MGAVPKNLQGVRSSLGVRDFGQALEVSDEQRIGWRVGDQVFQVLWDLKDSAFKARALQSLKEQAFRIDKSCLRGYLFALGKEEAAIAYLLARLKVNDEDACSHSHTASSLCELDDLSNQNELELVSLGDDEDSSCELSNQKDSEDIEALMAQSEEFNERDQVASSLVEMGKVSDRVMQELFALLNDVDSNPEVFT